MNSKSYSHMVQLKTFKERYEYLRLRGKVGADTFGSSRYLNQGFYASREWKQVRTDVILRDDGCDLGIPDRPIHGKIVIHHINPITEDTLVHGDDILFDLDNLVCTSLLTHNAIHYGEDELLFMEPVIRTPYDTCPWKGGRACL